MSELEQIKALLLKIVDCKNIHGNQHVFCDGTCPCPCNKPFQPLAKKACCDYRKYEEKFADGDDIRLCLSHYEKLTKAIEPIAPVDRCAHDIDGTDCFKCFPQKPADQLCGCPPSAGQLGHSCKLSERPPLPGEVEKCVKFMREQVAWMVTYQTDYDSRCNEIASQIRALVRESDKVQEIHGIKIKIDPTLNLDEWCIVKSDKRGR